MLIHEISMKKRKVLDRIYRLVLIVVTILIDVGVFTYAKNSGIEMLIIIGKKVDNADFGKYNNNDRSGVEKQC